MIAWRRISRMVVAGLVASLPVAAVWTATAQERRDMAPHAKKLQIALRRTAEPKENAFTLLAPKGWLIEGGIYRINPLSAGGPFNSMWPKCDLTLRSDAAGTVMWRLLPSTSYADFSDPRFAIQAKLFPPGSKFNGGLVRPLPRVQDYLLELFRTERPGVKEMKILQQQPLPELAEIVTKSHRAANDMLAKLNMPAITATAGVLVVEYREGAQVYKEAYMTNLVDGRGVGSFWCNSETLMMRAPADQAAAWQPVMDVINNSVRLNPDWVRRQAQQLDRVARILAETAAQITEDRQRLWENRQRIMDRIDTDWMLYRTGQADYRNPYTGQVERDSNAWRFRWVTRLGDVIFTDDPNYNPNSDRSLWSNEWQVTSPP